MIPLTFETKKFREGYSFVIGTDEVGRGSLAGPVVAAAVAFESRLKIKDLRLKLRKVQDSKVLSRSVREILSEEIKKTALAWGVGIVFPDVIDEINIHHASLKAMMLAVKKIQNKTTNNTFLFVDGKFTIPNISVDQNAVVDGDAKIFSVACASIIAKVYRDNLMRQLHVKLPQYNFAKHKGYATLHHHQAILKYGISEYHRKSFCKQYL